METIRLSVPAIHCNHCTYTIKMELHALEGVKQVEADANSKVVQVTLEPPATRDTIVDALNEINYPPEPL